jgi:hypothetical protein
MKNRNAVLVFVTLFLLAVLSRWVGHAWNFTVVGGAFLFAGAYFADKKVAVALMLSAMLVSDLLIGFHTQMLTVYFSYLVVVALGFLLSAGASRLKIAGLALLGSTVFYIISNFGVWYAGTLYPLTAAGLFDCYVMAIPFYRNQLISDVLSAVAIFEVAKAVGVFAPVRANA